MKTLNSFHTTATLTTVILHLAVTRAFSAPAYTAHEWGTFTSVQGSDGQWIPWNPFVGTDLPDFVYDRRHPSHDPARTTQLGLLNTLEIKFGRDWLQRMETPVIYFHAEAPLTVDVKVDFPHGLLTEWYPSVTSYGPRPGIDGVWPVSTNSFLAWQGILIAPPDTGTKTPPPAKGQPNHYFAARQTSARPLVTGKGLFPDQPPESEQFLFYRGAGNFTTPLRARVSTDGMLILNNESGERLESVFVYETKGGRASWQRIEPLDKGEHRALAWPISKMEAATIAEIEPGFHDDLKAALTQAGLFADEAEAMIQTWRSAWLSEAGLRVLYLLPRTWTEATLPLELDPAPQNLVRVMVGRAELFRPTQEAEMDRLLTEYLAESRDETLRNMSDLVAERFLEPALRQAGDRRLARQVWSCAFVDPQTKVDAQTLQTQLQRIREAVLQLKRQPDQAALPNDLVSVAGDLPGRAPQDGLARGAGAE